MFRVPDYPDSVGGFRVGDRVRLITAEEYDQRMRHHYSEDTPPQGQFWRPGTIGERRRGEVIGFRWTDGYWYTQRDGSRVKTQGWWCVRVKRRNVIQPSIYAPIFLAHDRDPEPEEFEVEKRRVAGRIWGVGQE